MGEMFIYKCKMCGQVFELFHHISEPVQGITCPECGNSDSLRIQRLEHKGACPHCKKDVKKEDKEQ